MTVPKWCLFFDFHTMPANPDVGKGFDMEAITDRFVKAGVKYVVFPARCNLGTAYYNTEIGTRHPALTYDLLGELTKACHRRGIKISAYINLGLSHEEGLRNREWLVMRSTGQSCDLSNPLSSFFRQMCYHTGYGDHAVKLAFQHRLHEWLPYYKEAALSWDLTGQHRMESQVDPFSYYCAMGPMIFSSIDVRCEGLNVALHNQLQAVWRRAVPYIHMGDYYALTEFEKRADRWLGWQFHNPCDGSGMLQAIRLQEAPEASCTLRLRALDADARLQRAVSNGL